MAVTQQSLEDIIGNNDFHSLSYLESEYANTLINNPSITMVGSNGRDHLNAYLATGDNLPAVLEVGYSGYDHAEWNTGNTSDDEATAEDPFFLTYKTKTHYKNRWFNVKTIQRDLIKALDPVAFLNGFIAKDLITYYNTLMAATLAGMSDITGITVGNGTANFSQGLVQQAEGIKGDAGYKSFSRFYMNSATVADILMKQRNGTIKNPLIEPLKIGEQATIRVDAGTDGSKYGQSIEKRMGGASNLAYLGSIPIVLDDNLKDGVISILEEGAFAFAQTEFKNPISYHRKPMSGNGSGKEVLGMRVSFIMHPVGFNFVGEKTTNIGAGNYANTFGLSLAELISGGQYEAGYNIKETKIIQIKVKVGGE